jgi:formiminotetrahydrofolate cyclodeaminase
MGLIEKNVAAFVESTAASTPTPGGGSIAALAGALGSALAEMVAGVTIGKKKYAAVEDDMKRIAAGAHEIRTLFVELIERDASAFDDVMAAFALCKDTDEDKKRRVEAIEAATQKATAVPLDVMKACGRVMALIRDAATKGNSNAVSDAGVAALMTQAACRGAYFNVRINAGSLNDQTFVADVLGQAESVMRTVDDGAAAVRAHVESSFSR